MFHIQSGDTLKNCFIRVFMHCACGNFTKLYLTLVQLHRRIWDPYLVTDFEMIESIQKFASRVRLKQWSRDTRYQDMLEILNMPSLAAHRRQRKLCTLYKVNNNLSEYPSPPPYPQRSLFLLLFCTLLVFCTSLCILTSILFFPPRTISLWNNLPYNVVSTVPFSTFKSRISEVC